MNNYPKEDSSKEQNGMKLPFIHFDCKFFVGEKPCFPNKQTGVFCDDCQYYERDETIQAEFPSIPPVLHSKSSFAAETNKSPAEILIIKLDASGDVLRTTSVLPSLKLKYSDSSVTWLTKTKSYTLLKCNEFIDEIYFADDDLAGVYNKKFDLAVNLDTGSESCEIMNKINAADKYGYRIANNKPYPVNELACEWYLMSVNDNVKRSNTKTYHRIIHDICGLVYSGTAPMLKASEEIKRTAESISKRFNLDRFRRLILVNLGGGNRWQNKKWTDTGYASVVNELARSAGECIGVIAGEEDVSFYNKVINLIDKRENIIFLGCRNSLDEFISVIYLADKVLTSDSLALHVATALNKYTVVLVGPTSHAELDVFGNGKILRSPEMECRCFYESECRFDVNCMTTLPPSLVTDALK